MPHRIVIYSIRATLRAAQEALELFIAITPSGHTRNLLTDANIHIGAAIGIMIQLSE